MNRHFLVLAVLSLSTLVGPLACSGASPADGTPGAVAPLPSAPASSDAAIEPSSSDDAGSPVTPSSDPTDDAAVAATTSSADAAQPPPTGSLVAGGPNIVLHGITDDGWIAYSRAGMLLAAPLSGGPSLRVTDRATAAVTVSGTALFAWPEPLLPNAGTDLDVWTSAHQLVRLTDTSFAGTPVAASADGLTAAFFTPAGLTVSHLDGTNALALGPLCASALAFDGAGDLVSTNCPATLGDAGSPSPNLSVFSAPTLARTLLAADTSTAIDPTGSWVWVVDDDAGGRLVRASDGSVVFSDPLASGSAVFDASGTTLFYVSGDALESLSIASPKSPTTIVPSEVRALLALSPDGKQLVYEGYTGIFQQATTAGAPAVSLAWTEPNATYRFTADSADVLITAAGKGPSYYTVQSVQPRMTLSRGPAYSVAVLSGSDILVVDAPDHGLIIDVTRKSPRIELPQMGAFALSHDRTQIAYVVSGGGGPGLYTVSITEGAAGTGSQLH